MLITHFWPYLYLPYYKIAKCSIRNNRLMKYRNKTPQYHAGTTESP